MPAASSSSGAAIRPRANSRSKADRARGPATAMSVCVSASNRPCPRTETKFQLGLWPNTPQKCAGLRIDPPMSLPISKPVKPAASAAADPPDDPPGARLISHGLLVVP